MPLKIFENVTWAPKTARLTGQLVAIGYVKPIQVAGLNPLSECDGEDCRDVCINYSNKAFGTSGVGSAQYDNDVISFLINDGMHQSFPSSDITFTLQKSNGKTWREIGVIDSHYGQTYAFGTYSNLPNYKGQRISWGQVLFYHGVGCYRVKVERVIGVTNVTKRTDHFGHDFALTSICDYTYTLPDNLSFPLTIALEKNGVYPAPITRNGYPAISFFFTAITGGFVAISATVYTYNGSTDVWGGLRIINSDFPGGLIINPTITGCIQGPLNIPSLIIQLSNGKSVGVTVGNNVTESQLEGLLNSNTLLNFYGLSFTVNISGGQVDIDGTGNSIVFITAIYFNDGTDSIPFDYDGHTDVTSQTANIDWCAVSEAFDVQLWNCNLAGGTVKFESLLNGKIGDKRVDYLLHDFCGLNWYDSVRLQGFFGLEKIAEYREVMVKWGKPKHGKVDRVSDEAVSEFTFDSGLLPKEYHARLMTYGVMADELLASDYNLNNSDYNIKRMPVVKAGSYEPEYFDKDWARTSHAVIQFRKGVQGIIRTVCC